MPFKDCTKFFDELLVIKDQFDLDSLKYASKFTSFVMSTLISEVEDDIEKNQGEKHESISQRFDKIFDNRKKMDAFLEKLTPSMKQGLDEGCLEFSFPVNIQSGG